MSKHEWQMITRKNPPNIDLYSHAIKLWRNSENWYVFEYDYEKLEWVRCTEKRLITIMGNDYKLFAQRVDFESDKPTLRDQFAMAALTGLIVRSAEPNDGYERLVAKVSYIIADSMMEARK